MIRGLDALYKDLLGSQLRFVQVTSSTAFLPPEWQWWPQHSKLHLGSHRSHNSGPAVPAVDYQSPPIMFFAVAYIGCQVNPNLFPNFCKQ